MENPMGRGDLTLEGEGHGVLVIFEMVKVRQLVVGGGS
jgi:hypothetical protein